MFEKEAEENGDGRTPTLYFYEKYERFLKGARRMNCSECNKQMKKYLWGFTYFYVCEDCGDIILTSEAEE